jgi:predicted GTPase
MTQANAEFGRFQAKRDELVKIGESLLVVYDQLALTDKRDLLAKSEERLRSQGFRLLVLGEFNAGKSTLINALLGEPVLPRFATETTAFINEVKWGQFPLAVLHLKDGSTREVKVSELTSHVTVMGLGIDDSRNSMVEAPYQKAEIFYPFELCRNGVEIIDSPGLNAHELRERITLDYLSEVDAVLFVLNATQLANMSELRVIDNVIKPAGHDDIFFVANKANWLNPAEIDSVRRVAEVKLAPRTNHGMERVFFMNALGAADGRAAI